METVSDTHNGRPRWNFQHWGCRLIIAVEDREAGSVGVWIERVGVLGLEIGRQGVLGSG